MISIIVCSINEQNYNNLYDSIFKTIGEDVFWEIIKIDNNLFNYSISKAYNQGAKQAKFDILVFVHEDVIFHTHNWGKLLIDNFNTLENPGILGIAGSSYRSFLPGDWWVPFDEHRHFYYQSNKKNGVQGEGCIMFSNDNKPVKVFLLDGVFLSVKRSVFSYFSFSEYLKGFHGYDSDFSLKLSNNYNNYYIPGILIEHFSEGTYNFSFIFNMIKVNAFNLLFLRRGKGSLEKDLKCFKHFIKIIGSSNSLFIFKFIVSFFYLFVSFIRLKRFSVFQIWLNVFKFY